MSKKELQLVVATPEEIASAFFLLVHRSFSKLIRSKIEEALTDIFNEIGVKKGSLLSRLDDQDDTSLDCLLELAKAAIAKQKAIDEKPEPLAAPPLVWEVYDTPGDGPYPRAEYWVAESWVDIGTVGHGIWIIDEVRDKVSQYWTIRRSTAFLLDGTVEGISGLFDSVAEAKAQCQKLENYLIDERHRGRRPAAKEVANAKG
jgi:hypothetical protein